MKKIFFTILMAACAIQSQATDVLTLEMCRQMATENNVAVKQAVNNISASEAQVRQAFTNFFPSISGSGSVYHSPHDLVDIKFMGRDLKSGKNIYSWGINATLPLYAGGQISNGYKLSKIGLEASKTEKQKTLRDALIETEKYYWQIAVLDSKKRTIDCADSLLAELHRTVSHAVENGLKNRNDLLKVELRQAETKSTRIQLENAIRVGKELLAQQIGRADTGFTVASDITGYLVPDFPQTLKADHELAAAGMLEYRMLGQKVDASRVEVDLEYGKCLPTLAVMAGYEYTKFWGEAGGGAAVTATVQIPLSDWWGGSHAIRNKKKKLENSELEQINARRMLRIQLDKLWFEVEEAYENLRISQKSIAQAEENLRLNRNAYTSGTSTMTELLDAELLFRQARDKYADAYASYCTKISEYKQMVGYDYH